MSLLVESNLGLKSGSWVESSPSLVGRFAQSMNTNIRRANRARDTSCSSLHWMEYRSDGAREGRWLLQRPMWASHERCT